jgi:hypothetical protein
MRPRRSCRPVLASLLLVACSGGGAPAASGGADEGGAQPSGGRRTGSGGGRGGAVTGEGGVGGIVGAGGTSSGEGGSPPAPDAAAMPDAPVVVAPAGSCAEIFNHGARSEWVYYDAAGKLAYKPVDERGDRIMDFSYAGYGGGGVALPKVAMAQLVKPSGGDDTAAIQAAIDAVAKLPLSNGLRGAVVLAPGQFKAAGTLNITASGVVLRGSGSGDGGSEVAIVGSHLVLKVAGGGTRQPVGATAAITDEYLPVGSRSFTVASAAGFQVGDAILVHRPVTAAWRTFMGMDGFNAWLPAGSVQSWERTITAIDGSKITIDVPVPDSIDRKYITAAAIQKYTWDGRISQVGIEQLRFRAPKRGTAGSPAFLDMSNTVDAWVSDVEVWNTVEGLHFSPGCRRITATRVRVLHDPSDSFTEAAPSEWTFNSSEVLIDRSASKGALKIMMVTTLRALGPNVVLDFDGEGPRSHIQPHMYWATGLLVDRSVVNSEGTQLESAIAFINRGHAGSDHGWALGWGVAWNCTAPGVILQKPPGSMAWAIGCKTMPSAPAPAVKTTGPLMPTGTFESVGTPVAPGSLYLAQLCDRLGPQALANIGR